MMGDNMGNSSRTRKMEPLTQLLVRDLADLARAQAKLTTDLVQFLDRIQEDEEQFGLQLGSESADSIPRGVEVERPVDSGHPHQSPSSESETGTTIAQAPTVEPNRVEASPEPGRQIQEAASSQEEVTETVVAAEEGEEEPSEAQDATVLVLEAENARVGVLWDQVVQVGSIHDSTVPDRVDTDHGPVDLVSLGQLLQGVSREEQYFVVLAQEGEKVAVAFERMLGLGPVDAPPPGGQETPIQVLSVDLLRSFSNSPSSSKSGDVMPKPVERTAEEEERDRKGPKRALVAVRYLPARVAICRYLRGRGWQVGEAAGLEAAIVSLDLGRWDALFLEARVNGKPEEAEKALIHRVGELGVPVIRVGSRISGYPTAGGPALMFPFSESELESILSMTEEKAGS